MRKLWNFGLKSGAYGIATEEEIQEMCKNLNTEVSIQAISRYKDIQEWLCMGGELDEGCYIVKDGIIEVCGEDEDYEVILIPHLKIVA